MNGWWCTNLGLESLVMKGIVGVHELVPRVGVKAPKVEREKKWNENENFFAEEIKSAKKKKKKKKFTSCACTWPKWRGGIRMIRLIILYPAQRFLRSAQTAARRGKSSLPGFFFSFVFSFSLNFPFLIQFLFAKWGSFIARRDGRFRTLSQRKY